jgi:hypothetical protein
MSSTTTSLLISLIASSQNNKEVTTNSAFVALDVAQNAEVAIALSNADYTMPGTQLASGILFKFTGTLSANRHVNLPTGQPRLIIVWNKTTYSTGSVDFSLSFQGGTNTTTFVTLDEAPHLIYWDGVGNVTQLS